MSEESKEFNLMEAANELTADSGTSEAPAQETQEVGQSATNPGTTEGESSLSPQEILKQVGEEKPSEINQELLAQINAIGAIHNGLPITVNSPEQLKEILQKGFDYTKKTMSHAEEVKAKTEEFTKLENTFKEKETALAQKEQAIQNISNENKIMESLLTSWKQNDPELFEYIQKAYHSEVSNLEKSQPLIAKYESRFAEYDNRFKELAKGNQQAELGSIKQSWEKELNDVQTQQAASLAKLGVSPDWDKVKAAWSADSTNKMSVEDALYAVHGKDISKANESYQKLLATRNKTQAKIIGKSGIGSGQKQGETIKASTVGNYESILRQASQQI